MKRMLLLILLVMFAGGCATSGQVEQQQARLSDQQRQLERFEQLRPAVAQNSAAIDNLNKRIAALEGRIDELQRRLEVPATVQYPEAPQDPFAEREGATDATGLPPQTGTQTSPAQAASPESMQPSATQGPQKDPAQDLYDTALKQFNERNYQAAQATWKNFSETYKDNSLVPNALFWQGESFYQMRDYPKAILAYQEVISKYPKSPKYASALLKQGISFIIIGKKDAGRLVLSDVIKKFPNSPEAKRADEFLSNAN